MADEMGDEGIEQGLGGEAAAGPFEEGIEAILIGAGGVPLGSARAGQGLDVGSDSSDGSARIEIAQPSSVLDMILCYALSRKGERVHVNLPFGLAFADPSGCPRNAPMSRSGRFALGSRYQCTRDLACAQCGIAPAMFK